MVGRVGVLCLCGVDLLSGDLLPGAVLCSFPMVPFHVVLYVLSTLRPCLDLLTCGP